MIYEGMTVEELRELLLQQGYQARIGEDTSGSPKVESAASGLKFNVLFHGAEKPENRADSLSFICWLSYPGTKERALDLANTWNMHKRFAVVSVDDDDDLCFCWDVIVGGGVSDENMRQVIDRWADLVGKFLNHARSYG
jgi:Putative bacterial sensory transduction regulator